MTAISPRKAALIKRAMELDAMIAEKCETDLHAFVAESWNVVEPAKRFTDNWHVGAICEHLQAVTTGQIKNLGINVPPSTGKSTVVFVQYPAWLWIPTAGIRRGPGTRIMAASYDLKASGDGQAKMRDLVLSDWYRQRWKVELRADRQSAMHYQTTSGGWRMGVAVSAPRMGQHPHLKILDDPHNPRKLLLSDADVKMAEDFWALFKIRGAMFPAPNILIMQRLHEHDLCGYIRERESADWEWLVLPMRWEPKRMVELSTGWRDPRDPSEPLATANVAQPLLGYGQIQRGLGALLWPAEWPEEKVVSTYPPGSWVEASQAQQRPAPAGGLMFKRADFRIVHALPTDIVSKVRSWDVAGTSAEDKSTKTARTVGLRMEQTASGQYIITDIQKGYWESNEVDSMMLQTAKLDGPEIRIREEREGGSSGKAVIAYHRRQLAGYAYDEYVVAGKGSKIQRAIPLQAQSKGGNVLIYVPLLGDGSPSPSAQKMATEFLDEIELFPAGTLKDQVDAASQAFNVLTLGISTALDIVSGEEAIATLRAPEYAAAALAERGYVIPDAVDPDDTDGIEDLL